MIYSYDCTVANMRPDTGGIKTVLFSAKAEDILRWCAVEKRTEGSGGAQRVENKNKISHIAKYLTSDPNNFIPTPLLIGLRSGRHEILNSDRTINITPSETEQAGVLIDGQHRLKGICKFNPATMINIVGIISPSNEEIALQFMVINNKSSKVSGDHIRLLAVDHIDNRQLSLRLKSARLTLSKQISYVQIADDDPESPFLGLIKWPKDSEYVDGARVVVPAAIEESIAYLQDRNVKSFKESDDILLDFFFAIWNRAKVVYGEHFSLILEKIKVVLLTSFVSKMLIGKSDWGELDLADTDAVNTECEKILRHIPSNFWRCEWNGSGYDTKAGRDLLDRSIEKVYRNSRSGEDWYKDVDIINPASVASLR